MTSALQVPSTLELECLKENKPIPLRVNLVNGTFKTFNVDPYTLVQDVQDQLVQKYNLVVTAPFALYEAAEANGELSVLGSSLGSDMPCAVERILDPKERILDVYASWENNPLLEEEKLEGGITKKKKPAVKEAAEAKKELTKVIKYNSFLYKAKLVLKTT